VCVNDALSLKPQFKRINSGPRKKDKKSDIKLPKQRITAIPAVESEPMYDLDQMDLRWLRDMKRRHKGTNHGSIELDCFEKAITKLELESHHKFVNAIATEEGLGIEYDATIPCDVCGETDAEEGNEMIFCDVCNVCVHQACYGIRFIPEGSWLCRPCMQGIHNPECMLCPKAGGAMKPVRYGIILLHVCLTS
jgi:protein Jade-1